MNICPVWRLLPARSGYPGVIHLLLTLILALSFSTVQAATYTVINLNDSGAGSLRQAVIDANVLPTSDDIVFAEGLTGTILLTSGQISITQSVNILGPGRDVLAISGNPSKSPAATPPPH
jgi:hypothetical protein